jgi:hypothetical protein
MTADDDRVALYLAQLQDELRNVAPRVRDQVVREVALRIVSEREAGGDVRAILEGVGDPLDIAADVRERHGVRERSNWRETAAVLLLLFGGVVIPIAGWFVGVYLLWSSTAWSVPEKLAGTVVLPLGTLGPLLLVGRSPWYALLLVPPLATSGYLALRIRV